MKRALITLIFLSWLVLALSCKMTGPTPGPSIIFTPTNTPTPTQTLTPTPTPTVMPPCGSGPTGDHCAVAVNPKWFAYLAANQTDWDSIFASRGCAPIPTPYLDFARARALVYQSAGLGGGVNEAASYCDIGGAISVPVASVYPLPPPAGTPAPTVAPIKSLGLPVSPEPVLVFYGATPVCTLDATTKYYAAP